MSLVIAFIGKNGAVMAGDMREITFEGEKENREKLEKELYSGAIISDAELDKKSEELGVRITVRDNKSKIEERDGVLVGEVSSIEGGVTRKRRIYVSAGNYVIAEIEGPEIRVTAQGKGSNFIAFGNETTKAIANKCFKDNWKKGNLQLAVKIIMLAMETAARKTASVSKKYMLLQTASKVDVSGVVEKDMKD